MSDADFSRYLNIAEFATRWRGYKIRDKSLDREVFRRKMLTEQYIITPCSDAKHSRRVDIILFSQESKYTGSKSANLKGLLKNIDAGTEVMLITYGEFNNHHLNVINNAKHLIVHVYYHVHFNLIMPHAKGVSRHRIMTRDEVRALTRGDLFCYLQNLPRIMYYDTQCIWIGAQVGDVVEIKMPSDITGFTLQYRVVGGKAAKMDAKVAADAVKDENVFEEEIKRAEKIAADGDVEELGDGDELGEVEEMGEGDELGNAARGGDGNDSDVDPDDYDAEFRNEFMDVDEDE